MENLAELRGLKKRYGKFTLDIPHLNIPKGYVTGIIGTNGAGKTTLIKCITGGTIPNEGTVSWMGKGMIGMVMDQCPFEPQGRQEHINIYLKQIFEGWDERRFFELCDSYGLDRKQKIVNYSTGMKKKLQVAALLSHPVSTMFLDEPTAGMDPAFRDEFLDKIREFMLNEEHTVVISSHIISDLEKIADYLIFIKDGRILLSGSKDEITEQYGMVRSDLDIIDERFIVSVRSNRYGSSALICDRKEFSSLYPDVFIDRATLEDIMIYLMKEESE